MSSKKVVITGGPGSGKSTLINELLKRGYHCLEEISRQVTLDAQKQGIDQLFLSQPLLFSELLLKGRLEQFESINKLQNTITFFDRGIHDVLAYMDYIGDTYPDHFKHTCQNTQYDAVYTLKPWKAIYKQDNERYETFDQALKIHDSLLNTYQNYNYKLIDVPFDSVENRANFILKTINN